LRRLNWALLLAGELCYFWQMTRSEERQAKLVEEFSGLATWEDRYKRIIERGKALGDLPEAMKDEKSKVRGCQSQVWLHASLNAQKEIIFQADSDALIVKGLIAVLLSVYSGLTPAEILAGPPQFLKDLGLEAHLSPNRANGLHAMIKQIVYYATAFQTLLQMQK
jgi:cysteine desulfuration protein SufE